MKLKTTRKVILQITVWFLIWLLISVLISNAIDAPTRFLKRSIFSLFGISVIVSSNMLGLLPKFYFKKRILLFIVAGFLVIFLTHEILYLENSLWNDWLLQKKSDAGGHLRRGGRFVGPLKAVRYMAQFMPLLIAFLGNSLWVIAEYALVKEKEILLVEKEKLQSDVKFLKSQVNPHFLFNALNNIYSLSVLKSDKTPESLLSLSQMLRYMLYESDIEKVSLKKEIDYIHHFVELQLLKDSRGLNVTVDTSQANPNLFIAPLLFIPFVENAFKHSHFEDLDNGFINITLHTIDKNVMLHVTNSIPEREIKKDAIGGIGLDNVKNRLELLYPNAHQLNIKKDKDIYSVNLNINTCVVS